MKGRHCLPFLVSGILLLSILAVNSPQTANAQLAVTTATLSGTVTDPSGAVLAQATVTLTSVERGITRTFTTGPQGNYSFSQLPPSTYQLQIQAQGFNQYIQKGILLDSGQSATQNVTMTVGSTSQSVVVTAQASVLNTDNANIGAEVDSNQIVELPLNQRNIYSLTTLNSSVNNTSEFQVLLGGGGNTTDDADQDVSFLNFAGGFFGTTAYLLDGAWDTDPEWGAVMYVPSVDETQEFKIQNNSFTAQYGWSTGNVVNVTTKSGTDTFHGDVYEFYRNSAMDANLWFSDHNGLPKQSLTRNQTGVAAGGPLYIPHLYQQKNKTFVYGVYEHFGVSTPSVGIFTVPDANFRAGNFSELLGAQVGTDALGRPIYSGQIYNPLSGRAITAGAVDPTTGLTATTTGYIRDPIPNNDVAALGPFSAVGAKLLTYYPAPTSSGLSNNFTASGNAPAASDEYSIRGDQNISDASRFYFRYSYKSEYKTGEPAYFGANDPAGQGNRTGDSRYNMAAGYSHIFNQTFTVNISSGVQLWHEQSVHQQTGFLPSSLGLPTYLDAMQQFPQIVITGQSNLGESGNSLFNHGPEGTVAVDFTKTAGKHTLSFGFMGVNLQDDEHVNYTNTINIYGNFTCGPNPYLCTANTGNGVAQTLLGLPDSGSTGLSWNPAEAMHWYGEYVQDDWRILPKLTLNLGFRYEIQSAPTYRHDRASVFNPDIPNPIGATMGQIGTLPGALQFLSSGNRGAYNTRYDNLAPRIGFSYQALPRLVVRGGYGFFYPQSITTMAATADGFAPTTPIVSSTNAGVTPIQGLSLENPWPNGYVAATGNSLGELEDVGYGIAGNWRNRKSTYVQQYMFGLQYAFTPDDSLEVDYYGNHGTHMLGNTWNATQLDPKYLSLGTQVLNSMVPNPFYGYVAAGQSGCSMDQPTIVYSHLLEPFPQYCNVSETDPPNGFSLYNALEATYNHRFHNGLSVLVSYTFSKFLDNVEGNQTWAMTGNSGIANNYNMAAEKSVDANDVPQSLVVSYIYDLPIGRGKAIGSGLNRKTDAVVGGWEITGIVTSKSGNPLAVSGNNISSYGGNPRPDVIGDTHAPHQSIAEWFNTGAFAYAPYGTFGTASRFLSYMRGPDYNNFDTGIMKNWKLEKSMRIQFRAEMFNTFNHPQFYSPSGGYGGCDPNASSNCPSGFGKITSAFPNREVQMSGKFYW